MAGSIIENLTCRGNSGGFTSPAEDFGTLVKNSDGSYTYTAKDQTQLNYSSAGYLTSVVDTHGLATTYQYDSDNRLSQVNGIDGGVTTLTYDGTTGLLDTIAEPGGRVLALQHDSDGNLTQITDVDNTTRMFGYTTPSNHLITSDQWDPLLTTFGYMNGLLSGVSPGGNAYNVIPAAGVGLGTMMQMGNPGAAWASLTDGDDHMTQYLLDPRGRVLQQIEGDGTSTTTYQRNAAGLVTQTVDPMGRTTLDTYNSSGDLLQETAADGSWTQYQYDPTFHQVTQTLNSLGEQTSNSCDPSTGDLLSSTDAMGNTTTYTYYQTNGKSNGLVHQVTSPAETGTSTSTNMYDAARRLSISYDALNTPTYYAYDSAGNPSSTTDVYNHVTQTVYNGRNELVQSMDALGAVTTDAYNAYGEQTSETNTRGFTATTSYDGRGLVTARTDDLGMTVETDGYDGAGNLTRQTDVNGNATSYAYNADNELTQTTYADNSTTSETYDPDGEVVSSTDQLGRTTTDVYNQVGEQIASTDPMGRSNYTVYDSAGNVLKTIDPMGWSTVNTYDADNRVISTAKQVAAGVFETDTTVYDKAGEVVETIDPLGHKTFDNYNADGEETGTTDATGATTSDVYDLVGNLIQSTDSRGKVTKYSYDADNRQIAVLDPDGNLTQTVYDAVGNIIQTIDPKGTSTISYDADNRVVATKDADGNVTQQFYDANGNTVKSIDANGKITQNWFDALNRDVRTVDADGNLTATVYNAVGNVTTTTDGVGDQTQYFYDADNEQTSVRDGNGHVWFIAETRLFRKHAHDREERMTRMGGAMQIAGRDPAATRALWLKDIGNRLTDYKARFDRDPAEEGAKRWPFLSGVALEAASNYDPNTVTFFGHVLTINQLGNMMFGVMAQDLDLVTEARFYGQGKVKLGPFTGPKDPWLVPEIGPPRAAAFELGVKYAQKAPWNRTDFALINGYVNRGFRAPYVKDGKLVEKNRAKVTDSAPTGLLPSKVIYRGPQTDLLDHKAWGLEPSGEIKEAIKKRIPK